VRPRLLTACDNPAGRYTIVGPLGSGDTGVVYRARDKKLERMVATKTPTPDVLSGEEAR
jgi:serine/threonine protein kinase